MSKWVAVAIVVLMARGALAQQQQPAGADEYREGQAAIKKNDMDGAIVAFEKALAANPDIVASHYFLGFAYQSKKNYPKTAEHFTAYIDAVGNDPKAAEQIGHATRQGGLAWARTYDRLVRRSTCAGHRVGFNGRWKPNPEDHLARQVGSFDIGHNRAKNHLVDLPRVNCASLNELGGDQSAKF